MWSVYLSSLFRNCKYYLVCSKKYKHKCKPKMCLLPRAHAHTHTHTQREREIYICQNTHTSICLKIRIAALYYIEYAFDKCQQQFTINQLIFALLVVPVIGQLRLMLAPPNLFDVGHYYFIIGLSCLVSGAELSHKEAELSGPSCYLGRAV